MPQYLFYAFAVILFIVLTRFDTVIVNTICTKKCIWSKSFPILQNISLTVQIHLYIALSKVSSTSFVNIFFLYFDGNTK